MLDDRGTGRTAWVLVCEDDDELGARVAEGLREAGFTVDLTRNLAEACRYCGARHYDCLIVDRGLPDGDGLDLVRRQRESGDHTPALIITARDTPATRTEGYAGGADDYLAKPFSLGELATRVRALCHRRAQPPPQVLAIGDLVVDRMRRRVQRGGVLLTLTVREFSALELLAARPGSLVTRGELALYCAEPAPAVDELLARLERKLGAPQLIHQSAAGYRLHV
ncbi:response regulator transcription factor [Nocardia inohanensis]|uniref:response regulator transcription factor n=1 Tax=Nocardia inohanensis TaxID=209246 RepID=UPI000832540A|nr:response regulator transcription factor [Nocardia inohanensis]